MNSLWQRMIRASKLEVNLYEEVEADTTATSQAMLVVILSSLAAGIASLGDAGIGGLIWGTLGALVGWFVWAYLTYLIGTRVLPEPQTEADVGQLLRTIGFSSAPGVIRIFGIIPLFRQFFFFLAGLWMLVAMIIAVRQALDYRSTGRAVIVCLIGWLAQVIVLWLFMALFVRP